MAIKPNSEAVKDDVEEMIISVCGLANHVLGNESYSEAAQESAMVAVTTMLAMADHILEEVGL